eukprot:TRINITY_DN5619_c0_g1_i2.p1 TRINITY_DN5619_c0_g1~~TRINITY_DN5619_c0_g1_i2.p1  ORF type:complete len:326 (-),score=68.46 TRINITY_DN5619_c0_g1_i2:39-1016(-)
MFLFDALEQIMLFPLTLFQVIYYILDDDVKSIHEVDPHLFVIMFLIIAVTQGPFFLYSIVARDDRLNDFAYGLGFICVAFFGIMFVPDMRIPDSAPIIDHFWNRKTWVASLVIGWGMRLGLFLLMRAFTLTRDWRMRRFNSFFGRALFWAIQCTTIFLMSITIASIFSSRIDHPDHQYKLGLLPTDVIGLLLWAAGFILESVADQDKYQFKKALMARGHPPHALWCRMGVWKYSRHPNYFGEMLLWFGLSIVIAGEVGYNLYSFIAFITITILLLFVSGIPPLEKAYDIRFAKNPNYAVYKKNTPLLIPSWRMFFGSGEGVSKGQ